MTKTKKNSNKEKGHRAHAVIRCHIPYYSRHFFDPDGSEVEEGEIKSRKDKMIKIPVKIAADGDTSRDNVTSFEIRGISHYDGNIENVLETFMSLNESIVKPKAMADPKEEFKMILKLLHLLSTSGTAKQTLQEATRKARVYVTHQLLSLNHAEAVGQEATLIENEKLFFEFLERDFTDLDREVYPSQEEYKLYLFEEFKRHFWNSLHSIIFGADAYRAFKQQKDYLMRQIIKPFGVAVEIAFRQIEVLANLMEYFPPPSSRGKPATRAQWAKFNNIKKLNPEEKREMKYNLLPPFFHDRFDELEQDWTEMTDVKFLSEAQKCENADLKEQRRRSTEKTKEKSSNKRKKQEEDDDSVSTLSRSQKSDNRKGKRRKNGGETTGAGKARFCELCKLAGAPEYVYKTHYTNQCKKKDKYAQSLSGGAGQRKVTVKEYKSLEKKLMKGLKIVQKKQKKTRKEK